MDGVGQWRLVEPEGEDRQERAAAAEAPAHSQRFTFVLIAATVALVVAAVGVAIWATLPAGSATVEQRDALSGAAFVPELGLDGAAGVRPTGSGTAAAAEAAAFVVVDVQGAVVEPGVHQLPAGSRVADAIDAAGGYAPTVDIAATSRALNLAEKLADGVQIHVPALGEANESVANEGTPSSGSSTGLIDLNSATAEQLDTLPGIGPVTAAKIIDARDQAPFASVDDLLARSVVGASTFEKLRDMVTVAP